MLEVVMGQATIRVFAEGRFLKEIERPVRHVGGHLAVKYKGVLHPIINGNEVHLSRLPDTVVPASPVTAMPPHEKRRLTLSGANLRILLQSGRDRRGGRGG
jgi:hypothetical protein